MIEPYKDFPESYLLQTEEGEMISPLELEGSKASSVAPIQRSTRS